MWCDLKYQNGFLDKLQPVSVTNGERYVCWIQRREMNPGNGLTSHSWSQLTVSFSSNQYVLQVQHIMCNHKTKIPVIILIMMRAIQYCSQPLCNYQAGKDHKGKLHYANILFSYKGSSGIHCVHCRGNISLTGCQTTTGAKSIPLAVALATLSWLDLVVIGHFKVA